MEQPGLTRALVPRVIHHARLSFDTAVGDVVTAVDGEKLRSARRGAQSVI